MSVLESRNTLQSSVDLNTKVRNEWLAVHNPTNGPAASDFFIEVHRCNTTQVHETGQIAFSGVMASGDKVTVNDGVHAAHQFTFGDGTGGTVAVGVTATDSAQNLKAAIVALGVSVLNVGVSGAAATLTLTNNAAFFGGTITEDADSGNHMTVTNFSGGDDGMRIVQTSIKLTDGTQERRVYNGSSWGSWA